MTSKQNAVGCWNEEELLSADRCFKLIGRSCLEKSVQKACDAAGFTPCVNGMKLTAVNAVREGETHRPGATNAFYLIEY